MNAKLKKKGKLRWAPLVLIALLTALPEGGQGAERRNAARITASAHRPAMPGSWAPPAAPALNPYPYSTYYYSFPYPYAVSGYYAQPIVVISPAYDPYYVSPSIIARSPYYCLAHRAGWVSRTGMLDHLSGAHKIPLATAASVCPDASQGCIVDGY